MKKILASFLLMLGIQLIHAHPSLTEHSHDTVFGTYGWIIIPITFILLVGFYYSKREKNRSLR